MKTAKLPPTRSNGSNGHTKVQEAAAKVIKSKADEAREVIAEDEKKRVGACIEEIKATLKKHNCDLMAVHPAFGHNPLVINGVPAGFLIRPLAPS